MSAFFIFNNLKVSLHPCDAPVPGFELLAHENQCSTIGTLWDIGNDAGFTLIGKTLIRGQLWIAKDMDAITELEDYLGVYKGLTVPEKITVDVVYEDIMLKEELPATIYKLATIKPAYKMLDDGWWTLYKR